MIALSSSESAKLRRTVSCGVEWPERKRRKTTKNEGDAIPNRSADKKSFQKDARSFHGLLDRIHGGLELSGKKGMPHPSSAPQLDGNDQSSFGVRKDLRLLRAPHENIRTQASAPSAADATETSPPRKSNMPPISSSHPDQTLGQTHVDETAKSPVKFAEREGSVQPVVDPDTAMEDEDLFDTDLFGADLEDLAQRYDENPGRLLTTQQSAIPSVLAGSAQPAQTTGLAHVEEVGEGAEHLLSDDDFDDGTDYNEIMQEAERVSQSRGSGNVCTR